MAYTPYKPATNPSGNGIFDIFSFNIEDVVDPSGIVRFSNPFIVLGAATFNTTGIVDECKFFSYSVIFSSLITDISFTTTVNSGILKQTDNGLGTITENGSVKNYVLPLQKLFNLFDDLPQGTSLTQDLNNAIPPVVTGSTVSAAMPAYYSNFQLLDMINTSFDTYAFPANTVFTLNNPSPGTDFKTQLIFAVKRGNSQPFFTILPS